MKKMECCEYSTSPPIHLSLEEVAVHAGHKVLMEVDYYFTDCWWTTRDFRPAAQASPNLLTKPNYCNI